MGILSADTSFEIERIQFEILRSQGIQGRLRLLSEAILGSWVRADWQTIDSLFLRLCRESPGGLGGLWSDDTAVAKKSH
jgi:hypothetical protein